MNNFEAHIVWILQVAWHSIAQYHKSNIIFYYKKGDATKMSFKRYKMYYTCCNYVNDTKRFGFSSIVFDRVIEIYRSFLDWMETSIIIKAHSGDGIKSVFTKQEYLQRICREFFRTHNVSQ